MNSLKRRRDFTFKFLLRKQIEYGERDTKMRTLNKNSTVLKDNEERREVRASISIGVQEEEGSGNHRPPPQVQHPGTHTGEHRHSTGREEPAPPQV